MLHFGLTSFDESVFAWLKAEDQDLEQFWIEHVRSARRRRVFGGALPGFWPWCGAGGAGRGALLLLAAFLPSVHCLSLFFARFQRQSRRLLTVTARFRNTNQLDMSTEERAQAAERLRDMTSRQGANQHKKSTGFLNRIRERRDRSRY